MALEISYTDDDSTFYLVEFDVVTRETHSTTSTITSHAVERGANLTDFKRPGNRIISLECVVSNTPLNVPGFSGKNDNSSNVTMSTQALPGVVGSKAVTKQFSREFNRVKDMFDELYSLTENAPILTVATDVMVYENVQMINVSAPRTADDGDSISFTVDMVQIRIAETRMIEQPTPTQPRGRRATNNGGQSTRVVDTDSTSTTNPEPVQFNAARSENSNFGAIFGG